MLQTKAAQKFVTSTLLLKKGDEKSMYEKIKTGIEADWKAAIDKWSGLGGDGGLVARYTKWGFGYSECKKDNDIGNCQDKPGFYLPNVAVTKETLGAPYSLWYPPSWEANQAAGRTKNPPGHLEEMVLATPPTR